MSPSFEFEVWLLELALVVHSAVAIRISFSPPSFLARFVNRTPRFFKRARGIDGVLGILNALIDLCTGLLRRTFRLTTAHGNDRTKQQRATGKNLAL